MRKTTMPETASACARTISGSSQIASITPGTSFFSSASKKMRFHLFMPYCTATTAAAKKATVSVSVHARPFESPRQKPLACFRKERRCARRGAASSCGVAFEA
jgi:hypothetical protein